MLLSTHFELVILFIWAISNIPAHYFNQSIIAQNKISVSQSFNKQR